MRKMLLVILLSVVVTQALMADQKFSGYVIGEYYYVYQSHNDSLNGENGFWFRRIYFTYDNHIYKNLKARLRFEMASPGDFTEKDVPHPAVKDAYISLKKYFGNFTFGIQGTPTFSSVEKIWGYRSIEKTPLDLQKWASSRDFGLSLKGKRNILSYYLMFGNGSSNKSETDKTKNVYASLGITPFKGLYAEVYGDYRIGSDDKPYTMQGFLAYSGKKSRFGIQYARRGTVSESPSYNILSGFGILKLKKNTDIIVRYDKTLEANKDAEKISYIPMSPISPSNFIIMGVSFSPLKGVKVIPNLEYVFYSDSGINPDIFPRLTLYYKF